MYSYSEETKELLDKVLKVNDIYHINSLPIEFTIMDVSYKGDPGYLSFQWLYDRLGFYSTIRQYDTFIRRIVEFQQAGDYLNTLRQRLNITHEMIKCNLDSNLPVHISCCNYEGKEDKKLLDLKNIKKHDFLVTIHPGQTRAQGSVFLRDPLKNVLLYIKKDQKIKVKEYNFIKKISNKKQLLKVFREDNTLIESNNSIIDFFMPGSRNDTKNGLKFHPQTDTLILKCNSIKNPDKVGSLHSSATYLPKTFISMNNFSKIFFNKDLNIYTDHVGKAKELIEGGRKVILNKVLKEPRDNQHYQHLTRISQNTLKERELNGSSTWDRWANIGKLGHDFIIQNLTEKESFIGEMTNNLIKLSSEEIKKDIGYRFIETDISNFKKVVEKNEYKGFCIIIDNTKISSWSRDIFELLFCIPPSHSIARTHNNSIAIINCEHSYWEGKGELTEYIINKNFRKEWQV